jgi:heterodisulfide reductase subunit B
MKIGYYPGCSLLGSSREYGESLAAIAPLLGLELTEVPDWNCCGASAAHTLNHKLGLALPARILALAERAGLSELLVPCSACFTRLAGARYELSQDENLRREISRIIELPYNGTTRVLNVVEVLGRCAANGLKDKVQKPFGRKVACYYGCYLTRPAALSTCKRAEDPQEMDDIVKICGAEPIDWAFKVECCGAGLSVARLESVARLAGQILDDAVGRGAEAIVVACPMCHTNLDLRRDAIQQYRGQRYLIPVIYISQLIGLTLGLSPDGLGMHRHHVPVRFADRVEKIVPKPEPVAASASAAAPAQAGTEEKKG